MTDCGDLPFRPAGDGIEIRVRAHPGARRAGVTGLHGGALKVATPVPADRGRANVALKAILAEVLGVAPRAVELLAGAASRDKRFRIRNLDPESARRRLAPFLEVRRGPGGAAR